MPISMLSHHMKPKCLLPSDNLIFQLQNGGLKVFFLGHSKCLGLFRKQSSRRQSLMSFHFIRKRSSGNRTKGRKKWNMKNFDMKFSSNSWGNIFQETWATAWVVSHGGRKGKWMYLLAILSSRSIPIASGIPSCERCCCEQASLVSHLRDQQENLAIKGKRPYIRHEPNCVNIS